MSFSIARLTQATPNAESHDATARAATGRIVRILAGIALVAWGLLGLSGTTGLIVAVVGAVPLLAGLFDFCVFAPLFGYPLSGPKIRAAM